MSIFNPREWWEKWHPDKAPGRGRDKPKPLPPGEARKLEPNPHNRKKRLK